MFVTISQVVLRLLAHEPHFKYQRFWSKVWSLDQKPVNPLLVRNAGAWAPFQTYWVRICISYTIELEKLLISLSSSSGLGMSYNCTKVLFPLDSSELGQWFPRSSYKQPHWPHVCLNIISFNAGHHVENVGNPVVIESCLPFSLCPKQAFTYPISPTWAAFGQPHPIPEGSAHGLIPPPCKHSHLHVSISTWWTFSFI